MVTGLSNWVWYIGFGMPIAYTKEEVLISQKIDAW